MIANESETREIFPLTEEHISLEQNHFNLKNDLRESTNAKINRKMLERIVSRNLDLIILCLAEEQWINGYDITLFIRRHFDVWLSAGTVYSTFYSLERKSFLKHTKKGRVKYYAISKNGQKSLDIMHITLDKVKRILDAPKNHCS